ncbi:unnamed protein product [Lupinus luteus]|uniref:Uncharacterized protein n=1 Tax=Lupinus luteus TaxID=3873 RepID=A0AAV1W0P4_LUPLU
MGYWHFLTLSLCFFLCLLSHIISVSSLRLPKLYRNHNTIHGPKVRFDPTLVTQVSWRPRAFVYKGFLSEKECDHLINMVRFI